jgi:hypothetical protein
MLASSKYLFKAKKQKQSKAVSKNKKNQKTFLRQDK